jgi:hypothetical protein
MGVMAWLSWRGMTPRLHENNNDHEKVIWRANIFNQSDHRTKNNNNILCVRWLYRYSFTLMLSIFLLWLELSLGDLSLLLMLVRGTWTVFGAFFFFFIHKIVIVIIISVLVLCWVGFWSYRIQYQSQTYVVTQRSRGIRTWNVVPSAAKSSFSFGTFRREAKRLLTTADSSNHIHRPHLHYWLYNWILNALQFSQFHKAQNSIQPVSRRPNAK